MLSCPSWPSYFEHWGGSDGLEYIVEWARTFLDEKEITIKHIDHNAGAEWEYVYAFSYKIVDVASEVPLLSESKEILYVVGETDLGENVIERLEHVPALYQHPDDPPAYELKRSLIYSGTSLGAIASIGVHPFGASLVVNHFDPRPKLSQILLRPGYPVVQLLDASMQECLIDGVQFIEPVDHVDEGQIWLVYPWNSIRVDVIVLRDRDGDGALDDWSVYDYEQQQTLYPSDDMAQGMWARNYLTLVR